MSTPKRLATIALASAVSITVTSTAPAQPADILSAISAGRVAVISDGDYVARTYADSVLPPEEAGHADMLTVFSIADGRVTKSAIPVSNSVTAAPEILELTPDGRNAFVTERLGQRPDGARTARDLPAGNRVFAIDLSDAANPRLADTAEIGINPESLAVSPDGRNVAIVSNTSEASLLQIVEFSDGRFGDVAKFDLAALGIEGSAEGVRGALRPPMFNGTLLAVISQSISIHRTASPFSNSGMRRQVPPCSHGAILSWSAGIPSSAVSRRTGATISRRTGGGISRQRASMAAFRKHPRP
jgi:hypothetical protein